MFFTEEHRKKVQELRESNVFKEKMFIRDGILFAINKSFLEKIDARDEYVDTYIDARSIYSKDFENKDSKFPSLGTIALFLSDQHISIRIDIKEEFIGKGIGTQAMKAYLNAIFYNTQIDKITNLIGGGEENIASIKMHERLGFQKIGIINGNLYYGISNNRFVEFQEGKKEEEKFTLENIESKAIKKIPE